MSVDISQLTARLDPERREAVKQQYDERATNPTAAFLLCFFLGSAGAHRFYLREWRSGFAHLILFVLGVAALVDGLIQTLPLTVNLVSHPLGFALDVVGVVLLLAALIWEIIDLGRIDHQVYQRNLLLAEGIIAGTLLADQTMVEGARKKLHETMTHAHEQALAAAAPAAGVGIITANEVADARALAEETAGFSTISYSEVSQFDVSANPEPTQPASADAVREGNWTETATTAETLPAATADAAPTTLAETVTRTHTEDGPRVTDSYEVDRVAGPSAAEVVGLGAAGLGAAALGAGLYEAGQGASFDEPTQPDLAASATPQTGAYDPSDTLASTPIPTAVTQTDTYGFDDSDVGDVTDASMPAVVLPAADIAMANASPAYVHLPEEQAQQDAITAPYAPAPAQEPESPLYLIPEEPVAEPYAYTPEPAAAPIYEAPAYETPTYEAPTSVEPPAEAYVPPVPSVYSAPAQAEASLTPSWEQPAVTQPEPVAAEPQPAHNDTLAEVAGVAGLAGAGALAGEALAHSHAAEPTPEPSPEPAPVEAAPVAPAPPKMKKIRVKRQVVLDGQVVDEIVVEREVPADMDTAEAAAKIQEELSHFTPEQIAQRAHLAPNEEVEVRQRTEGSGAGE